MRKTLQGNIAAAFALLACGSAVGQEPDQTLVQCGSGKVQLALENNVTVAPRLTFRGIMNDERLIQKMAELERRSSQIAVLACSEDAKTARTVFLLSVLPKSPQEDLVDEKKQSVVSMSTVLLRFVGDRPHTYLEVDATEAGSPIKLLPEFGLLRGDFSPSFEIGDFVDVSDDPAFFNDNLGVAIDPVDAD